MKRHHVELASAGGRLWARCRCGWAGDRFAGEGAAQTAERQARHHEQAVAQAGTRAQATTSGRSAERRASA